MEIAKGGHVYIMTNRHNTTLYVGVSSEIPSRVLDHKNKKDPKSFTARYNLNKLVYYEFHESIEGGIEREKQLKAGSKQKKVDLINGMNPEWRDLYDDIKDW
jgi:putative endonuclease